MRAAFTIRQVRDSQRTLGLPDCVSRFHFSIYIIYKLWVLAGLVSNGQSTVHPSDLLHSLLAGTFPRVCVWIREQPN